LRDLNIHVNIGSSSEAKGVRYHYCYYCCGMDVITLQKNKHFSIINKKDMDFPEKKK